jgi:hypothetical protein
MNKTIEISQVLVIFSVEAMLVLAAVAAVMFLMFRAKKKQFDSLLSEMAEKEESELFDEDSEGAEEKQNRFTPEYEMNYKQFIEDAAENTKEHYKLCFNKKVELDAKSSVDEQIIALRHIFLSAEKALFRYDDQTPKFWEQLKGRLKGIITTYTPEETEDTGVSSEQVDALKKRIENLEMFKKLFFEMQSKMMAIQKEGEEIHKQAQGLVDNMDDGDERQGLLDRYQNSFNSIGEAVDSGLTVINNSKANESHKQTIVINQNLDEMKKLKDFSNDQHHLITKLKGKLQDLENGEADDIPASMKHVTDQLNQLERALKESEMCVGMLESDYEQAVDSFEKEIDELKTENAELIAKGTPEDDAKAKELLTQFAKENKELMSCIGTLEDENDALSSESKKLKTKLRSKIKALKIAKAKAGKSSSPQASSGGGGNDAELKEELSKKDNEIMKLQDEYASLEAQYLDVFQKLHSK